MYTWSEVNGPWPWDCFGAGRRSKRLRSQCLTCALATRKYWNPKLTPTPGLTEAARTLHFTVRGHSVGRRGGERDGVSSIPQAQGLDRAETHRPNPRATTHGPRRCSRRRPGRTRTTPQHRHRRRGSPGRSRAQTGKWKRSSGRPRYTTWAPGPIPSLHPGKHRHGRMPRRNNRAQQKGSSRTGALHRVPLRPQRTIPRWQWISPGNGRSGGRRRRDPHLAHELGPGHSRGDETPRRQALHRRRGVPLGRTECLGRHTDDAGNTGRGKTGRQQRDEHGREGSRGAPGHRPAATISESARTMRLR